MQDRTLPDTAINQLAQAVELRGIVIKDVLLFFRAEKWC